MIEISQDNPKSLEYMKMGLPQRNGRVLVDTRLPTLISPDDCNSLIREYEEMKRGEKSKFLVPGYLVSINFYAKSNANLIHCVNEYYKSVSKCGKHLFQVIDENNFKGMMNIDDREAEKEFLIEVGLIIGWFMCNRTLRDEVKVSFGVESEGEIIFKNAIMKTLQPF